MLRLTRGSATCFMLCWTKKHMAPVLDISLSDDFDIDQQRLDLRSSKVFALCVFPSFVCRVWLGARCGLRICMTRYSLFHPYSQKVCEGSQLSSLPAWGEKNKTSITNGRIVLLKIWQCVMQILIKKLQGRDLHGLPDFPKVCVAQGCLCGDAFIRVIGEHLIEKRQSWSRAARD